jgi:hypothetical protein
MKLLIFYILKIISYKYFRKSKVAVSHNDTVEECRRRFKTRELLKKFVKI